MTESDEIGLNKKNSKPAAGPQGAFADLLKKKFAGKGPMGKGARPQANPFVGNRGPSRSVGRGR